MENGLATRVVRLLSVLALVSGVAGLPVRSAGLGAGVEEPPRVPEPEKRTEPSSEKDPRLETLEAMRAELADSMARLRLGEHEAPYFIAYQLKRHTSLGVLARYGALMDAVERDDARLFVEVRVGNYDRDSSEGSSDASFFFGETGGPTYFPADRAPLDVDPLALRTALWLLTDQKYKAALSAWLRGKAEAVYVPERSSAGSFTREEPVRFIQKPIAFQFDRGRWERVARSLSKMLAEYPELIDSEVRITADKEVRTLVTSEGTELITEQALFSVHMQAMTRAEDGELLDNFRSFYADAEGGLPSEETLRKAAAEMVAELRALRSAPVVDPYTGPALLAPEATGVLFHEAVGHRLEGERLHDDHEGRTFKGQVGNRVLPPFIGLVDDPTMKEFEGTPLNGYYLYDDQGVPAQRVELIREGVLRNYLLSRKPVEGFERSNGHGRAQGNRTPVARMANLMVTSSKRVSEARLRQMLIAEARKANKPYALIIKDMTSGNTNTSTYGYQAFKGVPRLVYRVDVKTGKEELVRGVEIVGTPLASINKIVATSDTFGVFNGFCGAESGYVPVSTIAPWALVSEIELQRTARAKERAPLLPPPMHRD